MAEKATADQLRQIRAAYMLSVDKAIAEIVLTKEVARHVFESRDKWQQEFERQVQSNLARVALSHEFADEVVETRQSYFLGYKQPRAVIEQMTMLNQIFPKIGKFDPKAAAAPLPPDAEGKFLIPRWQNLARTYGEAVQLVLRKLYAIYGRPYFPFDERRLEGDCLWQGKPKTVAMRQLANEQKGYSLLVLDAQFGALHAGRSNRRSRIVIERAGQFPLGAFEVGVMLLTHPERMKNHKALWIDCAGDEFPHNFGTWTSDASPSFDHDSGEFNMSSRGTTVPCSEWCVASGFALR